MDGLDVPEISVLLLGDEDVGKSSFLSRLTLAQKQLMPGQSLPLLRDADQPFPFDIKFSRRQVRLEFSDTSAPDSYLLLQPAVIVLCFSIANPPSLRGIQNRWKHIVETHFNQNESIPIILLGLQRDVRSKEDYRGEINHQRSFVYPEEAMRVAQEMRLDRYCECSALTGELCHEVFEDIAKTAALTLTAAGGRSIGTQCSIL